MKNNWTLNLDKISHKISEKLLRITSTKKHITFKNNAARSTQQIKILEMSVNKKHQNDKKETTCKETNLSYFENNEIQLDLFNCLKFASKRAIELNRFQSSLNEVFLFPISFIVLNKITWICIQFFILMAIIIYDVFNNFLIYCCLIVLFYTSSIFVICESSVNAAKQVK